MTLFSVRVSKSSVRVLDLVTFSSTSLLSSSTSLLFVRLGYRLGYFSPRLGYFFLDFVTFFSPNRDDKFLRLVIIHKRDINIFIKSTSDAATYTSIWQQVYGIVKRNVLRGMEVPALMSSIVSPLGNAPGL